MDEEVRLRLYDFDTNNYKLRHTAYELFDLRVTVRVQLPVQLRVRVTRYELQLDYLTTRLYDLRVATGLLYDYTLYIIHYALYTIHYTLYDYMSDE